MLQHRGLNFFSRVIERWRTVNKWQLFYFTKEIIVLLRLVTLTKCKVWNFSYFNISWWFRCIMVVPTSSVARICPLLKLIRWFDIFHFWLRCSPVYIEKNKHWNRFACTFFGVWKRVLCQQGVTFSQSGFLKIVFELVVRCNFSPKLRRFVSSFKFYGKWFPTIRMLSKRITGTSVNLEGRFKRARPPALSLETPALRFRFYSNFEYYSATFVRSGILTEFREHIIEIVCLRFFFLIRTVSALYMLRVQFCRPYVETIPKPSRL